MIGKTSGKPVVNKFVGSSRSSFFVVSFACIEKLLSKNLNFHNGFQPSHPKYKDQVDSMIIPYNHTFQWGSKRTGPDLARVGGRYSDEWHKAHLFDPRSVVPESNMPRFNWLFEDRVKSAKTPNKLRALQRLGVPYSTEDIATAAQQTEGVKEIDALVAYLQQLGTVITGR